MKGYLTNFILINIKIKYDAKYLSQDNGKLIKTMLFI